MDERGEMPRKLDKAVKKDTVTVPDGGYTILRFHATNPGLNFVFVRVSKKPVKCEDVRDQENEKKIVKRRRHQSSC